MLTPILPASARWTGRGAPPSTYSLFELRQGSPALVYAALGRDACEAELRKRHIAFTRAGDAPGVTVPVRLDGPLHGIAFRSGIAESRRVHAHGEVIDGRLVLALDDFAATLAPHDFVEARVISAYRTAKENGCTTKYEGEQHCAALAVDVASFKRRDGSSLVIERDFHGHIGALTCRSPAAPRPSTPAATELWEIACSAAGREFQVVLTPNWNAQHKNHFHLELTTHDWVLVR